MRARIVVFLAYAGAAFTLLIAVAVPFYLYGVFTQVIGHAGLHIDPAYSGGTIARTFDRGAYRVVVYNPVWPHALQRVEPFVQTVFTPAASLPVRMDETVDLDGDGQPDIQVTFILPADAHAPLRGTVIALNGKYQSIASAGGDSFSRLLVRTGDEVIVRVPINRAVANR